METQSAIDQHIIFGLRWENEQLKRQVKHLTVALKIIADADAYDENNRPLGGGDFINLARVTLDTMFKEKSDV